MKFLIPKTAVRTLAFTAILLTLLYLLTPALFSQATTDAPVNTTTVETKDSKDAKPAETEKPAEAAPKKSPGLVDLFIVGGWSMWPLALASIVGFGGVVQASLGFTNIGVIGRITVFNPVGIMTNNIWHHRT